MPVEKWNDFLNSLSNEDLKNLINTQNNLWHMHIGLSPERRENFTGQFSFLYKEGGEEKNITEGVKECLSLEKVTPEIQKNILFCILRVYQSELNSREKKYNPTIFGYSLPIDVDWGVSKNKKLRGVNALFSVLSNTLSLEEAFHANEKALNDGKLGEIYSALKIIKENEFILSKDSENVVTHKGGK